MTLPSSGQIGLNDIYVEIYGSHTTQQISLRAMASAASFSVPDAVSEFYGYSAGSISINYTSIVFDPDGLVCSGYMSTLTVTSSAGWTVTETTPASWLSESPTSRTGSGTCSLTCGINTGSTRLCTLKFYLTDNSSIYVNCGVSQMASGMACP